MDSFTWTSKCWTFRPELMYRSSVLTQDVVWKTRSMQRTSETSGEEESGKSVLSARYDTAAATNIYIYIYIYIYICAYNEICNFYNLFYSDTCFLRLITVVMKNEYFWVPIFILVYLLFSVFGWTKNGKYIYNFSCYTHTHTHTHTHTYIYIYIYINCLYKFD